MTYRRNEIKELDPRQIVYVSYHYDEYGTEQLVINGKSYLERCAEHAADNEEITKVLNEYPDYEAYLLCNLRGWAVAFRTEKNENIFDWDKLTKIR